MGSQGMFDTWRCWQCDFGTRPSTHPVGRIWCCLCVGRALQAKRRLQLHPLARVRAPGIEALPFMLQQLLLDLDVFELMEPWGNVRVRTRARRKRFLWCLLNSHDSSFRQLFTYSRNRKGGLIVVQTEEILDRIMAFV